MVVAAVPEPHRRPALEAVVVEPEAIPALERPELRPSRQRTVTVGTAARRAVGSVRRRRAMPALPVTSGTVLLSARAVVARAGMATQSRLAARADYRALAAAVQQPRSRMLVSVVTAGTESLSSVIRHDQIQWKNPMAQFNTVRTRSQ